MMKNKYVNGMNEMHADDAFKQSFIRRVSLNSGASPTPFWSLRRRFTVIASSCMIILLLAIGGPLLDRNGNQANPSILYKGFTVTAYAGEGVPLVVQPDVEFPLGRYSVFMSSVPGFPINIVADGADTIDLQASEGELLMWNPADSKVIPQGQHATVKSGDTIYWSPLTDNSSPSAAAESILEISAYRDTRQLGSTMFQIQSQDHITYTGLMLERTNSIE